MNEVLENGRWERDEERHGDLLEIRQQDEWSFRKWKMREGWRKTWRSFRGMAARLMDFQNYWRSERGLDQREQRSEREPPSV